MIIVDKFDINTIYVIKGSARYWFLKNIIYIIL